MLGVQFSGIKYIHVVHPHAVTQLPSRDAQLPSSLELSHLPRLKLCAPSPLAATSVLAVSASLTVVVISIHIIET